MESLLLMIMLLVTLRWQANYVHLIKGKVALRGQTTITATN